MNDTVQSLLAELKTRLVELYGQRIKGVYLFGSYAREEADRESDLDVLIVLDDVPNYTAEIQRTSELVSEVSLRWGISVTRVFASERRWREDQTLFFLNVREEALPIL